VQKSRLVRISYVLARFVPILQLSFSLVFFQVSFFWLFCFLQGREKKEGSRSARCDCPCILSLLRNDDESWFVKRFCDQHSHPMSVSCGEKHRWPSHSRIDGSTRELIRHLRANNVQLSRVCSIVGTIHQTDSYVPFSR
jgi:hypothetical protein